MVRLTDRPDMTLDVYHGRKTTVQQQQQQQSQPNELDNIGQRETQPRKHQYCRVLDLTSVFIIKSGAYICLCSSVSLVVNTL